MRELTDAKQLAIYLFENKITVTDFSQWVCLSRTSIHKYLNGHPMSKRSRNQIIQRVKDHPVWPKIKFVD